MMTMTRRDALVKARDEAAALNPAPAVQVAPAPVRVNACEWAYAITGRYASVADARQIQHAQYLLNEDSISGLKIVPVGPDFGELDARLAAVEAPAVVEVAPCCDEAESQPCAACVPTVAPIAKAVSASLTLKINGTNYNVEVLPVASVFGTAAARLVKRSGDRATYDLLASDREQTCTCADFEFKRAGLDPLGCKHLKAARAVGLLPAIDAPDQNSQIGKSTTVEPTAPASEFGLSPQRIAAIEAEVAAPCCDPEEVPCLGCQGEDTHTEGAPSHGFADEVADAMIRNDAEDEVVIPAGCHTADELAEWVRPVRKPRPIVEPSPRPVKPAPLPDGRYTLLELIEGQVAYFRGLGNAVYDLMADRLADLAGDVKATAANSVAELADRLPVLQSTRDDMLRDEGYAAGRDSCPCGQA